MSVTIKQLRMPGMPTPPRPTVRDEQLAHRIAARLVEIVNLDEVYWTADEIPDRIWDVQHEIMRCGRPATVFSRLHKQHLGTHPYGWEGIDDHCRAIGDEVASEEHQKSLREWEERYA